MPSSFAEGFHRPGTGSIASGGTVGPPRAQNLLAPDVDWEAPADWPSLNDCALGNIALLVCDAGPGSFSFVCSTSNSNSSSYRVDWGDGSSTDHPGGTMASHTYVEGSGTACSRGYTTFKITISPIGGELTKFWIWRNMQGTNRNQYHSYLRCLYRANYSVSMEDMFFYSSTPYVYCPMLEAFECYDDMPYCTSLHASFSDCSALQYVDLRGLYAVTHSFNAFNDCSSLAKIDISSMTSLIDAESMFEWCPALSEVNLGTLPTLARTYYMFDSCYNLKDVNVNGLSAVTDADGMFYYCHAMESIDITGMTSLDDASSMFYGCYSLISINMTGISSIRLAYSMFDECYRLRDVDLSSLWNVTDASYMFSDCYSLQEADISSMTSLLVMRYMFYDCYALTSVNMGTLSGIESTYGAFSGCSALVTVDCSNLSNVTSAYSMFRNCYSLRRVDVSNMVSVAVTTYMFGSCFNLETIIATNFASLAPSVSGANMFQYCDRLKEINFPSAKFSVLYCIGASGILTPLDTITIHPNSLFEYGTAPQLSLRYTDLSAAELNAIFTWLPVVTGKTVSITGCTGASTCDKSIATSKGWVVA